MITRAFVSGRENRAFFLEGTSRFSVEGNGVNEVHPSQLRAVLREGSEYVLLENPGVDEVKSILSSQKQEADALFFSLATLDSDISLSTRVLLAQTAEDLLADTKTRCFVFDRLLSRLLPSRVTSQRFSLMQVASEFENLGTLLKRVLDSQTLIAEVKQTWIDSGCDAAVPEDPLRTLESELVASGFFARIITSIQSKDLKQANSEVVAHALTQGSLMRPVFLAFQARIQKAFFSRPKVRQAQSELFSHRNSAKRRRGDDLGFEKLLRSLPALGLSDQQFGAFKAKERVDKQIRGIREMLFAGKLPLAEKFVEELTAFQLGQDDRQYAVMSLCNLAAISVDANQFDFASTLSEFAVELGSNDPVAFTGRAEVYKQRGHFAAALNAYEDVLARFPGTRYALNGLADVLHEMGRFDEALQRYRAIQIDFPEDPVAFNGEIGVLRTRGEQRGALRFAVLSAKRFPLDAVTRANLAGCLAAVGKYSDSVRHYEEAISLDKNNARLITACAFAMRSAGRSEDALKYLEVSSKFRTEETRIRNARAQILQGLGRFEAAKAMYEEILSTFPAYLPAHFGLLAVNVLAGGPIPESAFVIQEDSLESEMDWIGYRTYAVSLVAKGKLQEAIDKLGWALTSCPWIREKIRLTTALGFAQMKANNPDCIETLQSNIEKLEDRQRQGRLLLLSHAHLQEQRAPIAKVLLNGLLQTRDFEMSRMKTDLLSIASGKAMKVEAKGRLFTSEMDFVLAA
jgi:tetratricopeptide (TPR) repeat protein